MLGACEPTLEVDEAGANRDRAIRALARLLSSFSCRLSRAEEVGRASEAHHRHLLHGREEAARVRHRERHVLE